jgi:hypothetical protein
VTICQHRISNRTLFTEQEAFCANKTWTKKVAVVNTAEPMSPASRLRKWLVLGGLFFALPALVLGQTNRLGNDVDTPISGSLRGDQVFPSVAFSAGGGFAAWHDNITDPSGLGISVRRLNANLEPTGAPIPVNQFMGNDQARPNIAMLTDGGAVVVWQGTRKDGQHVHARFLTSGGGFSGDELTVNVTASSLVNRYTTNWTLIRNNKPRNQRYRMREVIDLKQEFNANPKVIALNDGSVVVAYASSRVYSTNTFTLSETLRWDNRREIFITNRVRVPLNVRLDIMQDIYAQRLSAAGQKLGDEFRINQYASFNQRDVALAALDNGNFVTVWISEQRRFNNSVDVYARVFDSLGNPVGDEFLVNAANRICSSPSVARTAAGGFTTAWVQRAAERNNGLDVVARTFTASGSPASDVFGVNSFTYGDQFAPAIASLGSQQVIVWNSMGQDGSWEGVFGQSFDGSTLLGGEFRVNGATQYSQMHPRIASDGAGRALIIWSGYTTASSFDLFGRSYVAP